MATIRDVFLPSLFDFTPVYCASLKNIQITLKHWERKAYIPETLTMSDNFIYCTRLYNTQLILKKQKGVYISEVRLDIITDNVVYTTDLIMDLNKTIKKYRKLYLPPLVPKLRIDS